VPLTSIELPGNRSVASELYDWLRAAIESGELQAHERLVELEIARLAGVSRTPVREALHRLEVDRLVRDSGAGGREVCGFSLAELGDLCAVRETLEGMAAALAATSRSELECATLEGVFQAERAAAEAGNDVQLQVDLNHAFHETLWRASRNRYLADELRDLRSLIERMQESTLGYHERLLTALDEHRAILEAVRNGEPQEAERLVRLHFHNAMATRLIMSQTTAVAHDAM
jgi:DNA-binding GntR family transcriptional regulator